jgi:mono/diheme cytochrome c family protein
MKKKMNAILTAGAVALSVLLVGCGANNISISSSSVKVKGVAASGAPVVGTVTLTDASTPARTRTTTSAVDGSFSFNVSDLTPPFILTITWTDSSGTNQMYSFAEGPGTVNINPFSNAAFAATIDADPTSVPANPDQTVFKAVSEYSRSTSSDLHNKLSPLFTRYGSTQDPIHDEYHADHRGLDAMFDDVRITVSNGMIIVTNKETGAVIYTAPLNNIDSGDFNDGNMPGGQTGLDGAALYVTYCSSCHGPLATSDLRGSSASDIQEAIREVGAMSSLSNLNSAQIQAIATALSSSVTSTPTPTTPPTSTLTLAQVTATCTTCHGLTVNGVVLKSGGYTETGWSASQWLSTVNSMVSKGAVLAAGTTAQNYANFLAGLSSTPTPVACTYTYDAWGDCQPDNTQTRNVLTTSPSGCTGTPVVSQSCTYVPPTPGACTYTYDAWGACQPDNTQTRNVLSSTPSGCTGTPVTSQACTYTAPACTYTYDAWSACQPDNTQTRNVLSSTPSGCTGTPVISQACTYVPPACTYTYSAWGACQSNSTQTRTLLTSTPAGCSGTPVLTQSCTYTPPTTLTLAQVKSSCTGCHGLTVNTTVLKSGGYTVTGRSASQWLSTVNSMVNKGSSLASGTTAQDYANFLATLP